MISPLAVELRGRGTDRKHLRTCAGRCGVADGERLKVVPLLEITRGHHHLPHGNRVPVQKAVAPIVVRLPELALPGNRLDALYFWVETKVASVDIDTSRFRLIGAAQNAATTAVGSIDPVIKTALQGVGPQLL